MPLTPPSVTAATNPTSVRGGVCIPESRNSRGRAAREAGGSPSTALAAAAAIIGPRRAERARRIAKLLVERFAAANLKSAVDETFDLGRVALCEAERALLVGPEPDRKADFVLAGFAARKVKSIFVRYLRSLGGHPNADAVLAALTTTLAWSPLMRKRISRLTAESLPWWIRMFGTLIGASAPAAQHQARTFCNITTDELLGRRTLTETACLALLGREGEPADLFVFQTLIGLLLSNGPGTISAQGAKGAVAADGPENPERVQLNKAVAGWLRHCGFAHGGNGYEGIAFLLEQFADTGLADPADPGHGLELEALAAKCAVAYDRSPRAIHLAGVNAW
jgi:hypothetical protein